MEDDRTATMADPSQPPPMEGAAMWIAAIMAATANLIVALDLTIANVSIPSIAASLGASPKEGTWVITSYAVADAVTVPLAGWLAARFGPGRTFVGAVAGFGIASVLCGLSHSLSMLVAFRIIQGLSGGPMIPMAQSLLMNIFPKKRVNTAMAIWAMTAVVGPILGPILGGQICDHLSWPWIFFINAPFALVAAVTSWRLLAPRDPPPDRQPVDIVGFGLMITWIGAIQIVLDRGQDLDWFGSPIIIGLVVLAVAGFISFIIWELTDPHPIVNLRIFRHRGYSIVVAVLCLDLGAFFGFVLLLTLWLQTNMGYTPTVAAYTVAPGGLVMFTLSPFVAWLSSRIDLRAIVSFGLMAFAMVLFWQSGFASNATFGMVLAGELCLGGSVSFFFAPAMNLAMAFVPPAEIPAAAGMLSFARTISVAFATALTATQWQNAATRHRVSLTDTMHANGVLKQIGDIGFAPDQALRILDDIVQSQAVMLATNESVFIFGAAMAVGSLCIWLVPRVRGAAGAAVH